MWVKTQIAERKKLYLQECITKSILSFHFILFQFFVVVFLEKKMIHIIQLYHFLHHFLKEISWNAYYTVTKTTQWDKDFLYIHSYLITFKHFSSWTGHAPLKALICPAGTTLWRLGKHLMIRRKYSHVLYKMLAMKKTGKVQGKRLRQSPVSEAFS